MFYISYIFYIFYMYISYEVDNNSENLYSHCKGEDIVSPWSLICPGLHSCQA